MNDELKVEGINRDGFGIIPKLVMQDRELNINCKAIYAYFCSFAGAGSQCFPTRKRICYDMCISNDTLGKYLNQLVERGYISCVQAKEKGKFSHNVYTLNSTISPCPKTSDTESTEYGNLDTKNNNTKNNNIYNNNKEEKKENKESLSAEDFLSDDFNPEQINYNADNKIDFDKFYVRVASHNPAYINGIDLAYAFNVVWDYYPRKQDKKVAARTFLKVFRRNTKENLIKFMINLDVYKKITEEKATEPQYIKHMSSFINNALDDEIPQYNCQVQKEGHYYETKEEYEQAIISGEIEMYCLPRSCITF